METLKQDIYSCWVKVDGRRTSPLLCKGLYVVGSREPMRVRVREKHSIVRSVCVVGGTTLAYFI